MCVCVCVCVCVRACVRACVCACMCVCANIEREKVHFVISCLIYNIAQPTLCTYRILTMEIASVLHAAICNCSKMRLPCDRILVFACDYKVRNYKINPNTKVYP